MARKAQLKIRDPQHTLPLQPVVLIVACVADHLPFGAEMHNDRNTRFGRLADGVPRNGMIENIAFMALGTGRNRIEAQLRRLRRMAEDATGLGSVVVRVL